MSTDTTLGLHVGLKHALIGGGITFAVLAAVLAVVGSVGASEARILLEASVPTTRFLCSAVMTVSATTLALMLTLLGLSSRSDQDLKEEHYLRVRQIALIDVIVFIAATVLLVGLVVPFNESSTLGATVYQVLYYIVTGLSALLGGALVMLMLTLYAAVVDLIALFRDGGESRMVQDADDEASEAESAA